MKCQYCGYSTGSRKVLSVHEKNCLKNQEENGLVKKGQTKKPASSGTGYAAMEWNELKKAAAEKGIEVKGKKKDEILQALKELEGGQNDNDPGKGEGDPSNNGNGEG